MKTFSQFMEAVGDPIKPENVIGLKSSEVQKNLRSATKPSGPPPMQSMKPAKKPQQDKVGNFVRRMHNNTIFSPL